MGLLICGCMAANPRNSGGTCRCRQAHRHQACCAVLLQEAVQQASPVDWHGALVRPHAHGPELIVHLCLHRRAWQPPARNIAMDK